MTSIFFDTGVLLAAWDNADEPRQQAACHAIDAAIESDSFVTSVFVLYEFHRIAVSGLLLGGQQASRVLRRLAAQRVVACDANAVMQAAELKARHALKLGDALIVQAAFTAGCRVLYSDSLPPGLIFDSPQGPRLSVIDPLASVHALIVQEPAAAYRVQRQSPASVMVAVTPL